MFKLITTLIFGLMAVSDATTKALSPTSSPIGWIASPGMYCESSKQCSSGFCLGPRVPRLGLGVCADETVGLGCIDAHLESAEDNYTHPPGTPIGGCIKCDKKSKLVKGRCGDKCKCKKIKPNQPIGNKCCISCKNPCADGGYCIQNNTASFCVNLSNRKLGERCYMPDPKACKEGVCYYQDNGEDICADVTVVP